MINQGFKRAVSDTVIASIFSRRPRHSRTDFYVAPNGSRSGNGSLSNPWKLQTALDQPSSVQPGDTIWLRGGTYVGHFTSSLNGTSSSPIIVRQYAGERATLDGNDGTSNATLVINGSYAWFWGFEVMNSNPNRISGNTLPPPNRGEGVQLLGTGTKLINMIVHDADQGVLTTANTNEVYGNLFYYNGYSGTDRGHGHGIYAQHQGSATKPIHDNIIFDQFGYGHPRLRRGRIPRLPRLPGKHLLQQRRHLPERMDHEHPGRRPAGRHEPEADQQLHLQLRPGRHEQSRLQRRVHEPDRHGQLLRQRNGH